MSKSIKRVGLYALILGLLSFNNNPELGLEIGGYIDDFELKSVNGGGNSLSSFKDAKAYLVVLAGTRCHYSREFLKNINRIKEKYASSGLAVVAINPNDDEVDSLESPEEMVKMTKENGLSFPFLYDNTKDRTFTASLNITEEPISYLFQKTSKKTFQLLYKGGVFYDNLKYINKKYDEIINAVSRVDYLEIAVDEYLMGQKITINETSIVGCKIKKNYGFNINTVRMEEESHKKKRRK